MKKYDNIIVGISLIGCLLLFLCYSRTLLAYSVQANKCEDLIYEFADAINTRNMDKYVSLFSKDIQGEMEDYINTRGQKESFAEEKVEILKIEKTEIIAPEKSYPQFDDAIVFLVYENVHYDENITHKTYPMISGETEKYYVVVLEDDVWKLYRVSAVPGKQQSRNLSEPIETFIYFTRSENIAFYGNGTSGIYWNTYLKDVLPNEWYISYYSNYPHYGYASAMASKMYAWYNTVNPKWDYYPYYACMKDNSSDQNYSIFSYDNLASVYRNAEDSALSYISDKALVSSNNSNLFEIHYHATNGAYHSGTMSASGCLLKAQAGDTYATILHYYYDKSSYIGANNTAEIVTY